MVRCALLVVCRLLVVLCSSLCVGCCVSLCVVYRFGVWSLAIVFGVCVLFGVGVRRVLWALCRLLFDV